MAFNLYRQDSVERKAGRACGGTTCRSRGDLGPCSNLWHVDRLLNQVSDSSVKLRCSASGVWCVTFGQFCSFRAWFYFFTLYYTSDLLLMSLNNPQRSNSGKNCIHGWLLNRRPCTLLSSAGCACSCPSCLHLLRIFPRFTPYFPVSLHCVLSNQRPQKSAYYKKKTTCEISHICETCRLQRKHYSPSFNVLGMEIINWNVQSCETAFRATY